MKIQSCHIENFGKLCDYSIQFNQSPYVICQENGWGKSTLAAFLKVMFFGFFNENKRSLQERERAKYKPWQKGIYGGSVVFETHGKVYELNRVFGNKESEDTFQLLDARTKLPSTDYSTSIGEELFGINGESFLRTIYISQMDCETFVTDSMNAKLGNLVDQTDDINTYDVVQEKFKNIMNSMSPRRKTGSLNAMKRTMEEMKTDIRNNAGLQDAIREQEKRILEKEKLTDQRKADKKRLQERLTEAGKEAELGVRKEQYEKTNREIIEKKETLSRLPVVSECPQEEFLKLQMQIQEVGVLAEKIQTTWTKHQEVKAQIDSRTKDEGQQKKSGFLPGEWIGILIFLVCLIASIRNIYFVVGYFLGILIFVIFQYKRKNQNKKADLSEEKREVIEREQALLHDIDVLTGKKTKLQSDIKKAFEIRNLSYTEENPLAVLYEWRDKRKEYEAVKRSLEEKEEEKRLLEETYGKEKLLEERKEIKSQTLSLEMKKVEEQIEELQNQVRIYRQQKEDLEEELLQIEEKKEQLKDLEESYKRQQHRYEILSTTSLLLEKAKESLTLKHTEPILEKFKKYYETITGCDAGVFCLDANLELLSREMGELRKEDCFSAGCRDLMGICMRMALIDNMYPEEKPFIIWDDPFVNLDKEKVDAGLSLVKRLGEQYQIIYMTCHDSRKG